MIYIRWLSLAILQFHLVCCLSRGQVLEWILYHMPTILDAFQLEEAYWHHQTTTYQLQFMLHLVVDVLTKHIESKISI